MITGLIYGSYLHFYRAWINGNSSIDIALPTWPAKLTVMIFSIIWGVLIYVRFLGFTGLPDAFADWIGDLDQSHLVTLLMILAAYAILGIVQGCDWDVIADTTCYLSSYYCFGSASDLVRHIVVKMAKLCLITAPIGLNFFVIARVRPDISVQDVFRDTTPFFIADVVTIAVLIIFPETVLWLPALMHH